MKFRSSRKSTFVNDYRRPAIACSFASLTLMLCVHPATARLSSELTNAQDSGRSQNAPTRSEGRSNQGSQSAGTDAQQSAEQEAPPAKKKKDGVGGFFRRIHERAQTAAAEEDRREQQRRPAARVAGRSDERSPVEGGVRMKEIPVSAGQCCVEEDRFKERRSVDLAVGRIAKFDDAGGLRGIGELRMAFGIDIREGQDPNVATPPRTGSAGVADIYLEAQGKHAAGRPPAQPKVIISLQFLGPRPSLLYDNDLLAIVNGGRPLNVGRVHNFGRITFSDSHEDYQVWASIETFRRLAAGKQIEVKIKDLEFTLPTQAIAEMRRFAGCTGIRLE